MNKILQFALVGLGLLQILGFLFQSPALRGLGAMTAASPLPIVFTDVRGVETFASEFTIVWQTTTGRDSLLITPAVYARMGGPYNWRNVYGAAISYGPVLPDSVWRSILSHGLCGDAELARHFGIDEPILHASVLIRTKTAGRNDNWILDVDCDQ